MDQSTLALQLVSGLTLAAGAGLNAWIPALGVAVFARLDVIELQPSMTWLGSNAAIAVIAVLLVADFVGDKVPAVDSGVHAIGTVVHPLLGAVVLSAQDNLLSDVHPALGWALGGGVAGGIHLGRAALRPIVTTVTAGFGNWLLSLAEDAATLAITIMAIVVPIIGLVATVVMLWLVSRRLLRWRARDATELSSPHPPPALGQ